jgi:hypothetical protein
MDTNKIKVIVAQAKALTNGEEEPQNIMTSMVRDMARSPTFAVAIITHLKDKGVDLMSVDSDASEAFREKFRPQIEKLGENEFAQIRKISTKLFG